MNQTETSDLSRENLNNVSEGDVEYSSFSEEHKDLNGVLNDDTKFAEITGKDFTKELMVRLQNVIQISKSSAGLMFA